MDHKRWQDVRRKKAKPGFGYLIVECEDRIAGHYWLVWSGYFSPTGFESGFAHEDIKAHGTTREAAEAALRLLAL